MKDTTVFKSSMAVLVTIGLLGVILALMYLDPPAGARDALNIALGALVMLVKEVFSYYFGSSEGSARKTALLQGATSDQPLEP
jgi:drug/metabolite transporter (DMT)-like permease